MPSTSFLEPSKNLSVFELSSYELLSVDDAVVAAILHSKDRLRRNRRIQTPSLSANPVYFPDAIARKVRILVTTTITTAPLEDMSTLGERVQAQIWNDHADEFARFDTKAFKW